MSSPAPPEPPPLEIELFCPGCGYSLRGITSANCPECGLTIDRSAASVSRIPWEHRRRIGVRRAYWRTLRMPADDVAKDMVRPVNYRDARLFQLITVLIAALPIGALNLIPLPAYVFQGLGASLGNWPMALPPGWAIDLMLPLVAGAGLRVVVPVALVLALLAITGVPSYFFHPPHLSVVQQNRAIALSYYACTPLVLLLVPALTAWTVVLIAFYDPAWADDVLVTRFLPGLLLGLVPVAIFIMLLIGYVRMLRSATVCTPSRVLAMLAVLPMAWLVLGVLILGGLTWVAGYVMLVVWSFQ